MISFFTIFILLLNLNPLRAATFSEAGMYHLTGFVEVIKEKPVLTIFKNTMQERHMFADPSLKQYIGQWIAVCGEIEDTCDDFCNMKQVKVMRPSFSFNQQAHKDGIIAKATEAECPRRK